MGTKVFGLIIGCLLSASVVAGCGGGGHKGGGIAPVQTSTSPPPPTGQTFTPTGSARVLRLDILNSNPIPATSLQDKLIHGFNVPAIKNVAYRLTFDTVPSGRLIFNQVDIIPTNSANGRRTLVPGGLSQTPAVVDVTADDDGILLFSIFDQSQSNLSLTSCRVVPSAKPYSTSGYTVFVHFCGDSFAGLGYSNNLATNADKQAFVSQLLGDVNSIYAPTGIQINVGQSGFTSLSNALISASESGLISGGRTTFDSGALSTGGGSDPARWPTTFARDASDPIFGKALDIFIVNRTTNNDVGLSLASPAGTGLIFVGKGPRHGLVLSLFDKNGQAFAYRNVKETLAHELGHGLSLKHTTELDFSPGDIADAPLSTKAANDKNADGIFNEGDLSAPDQDNAMFPFVIPANKPAPLFNFSPGQMEAMKGYLSIREH